MLHAAFLRSVHPHARIVSIEVSRAAGPARSGAVITGETMVGLTNAFKQVGPPGLRTPSFYALAVGKVRFVGDPVAIVVAESRYLAEDGCDLIDVEYDPLDPVPNMARAGAERRPAGLGRARRQLRLRRPVGVRRRRGRVRNRRTGSCGRRSASTATPTSRWRPGGRWPTTSRRPGSSPTTPPTTPRTPCACSCPACSASPNIAPTCCAATSAGRSAARRARHQREDIALAAAARLLGRPVKWIEDRNENLMAAGQAREETLEVEMAVGEEGDSSV